MLDALHDRREDDREEGADVDEGEGILKMPGQRERKRDAEGEEDVAADRVAELLRLGAGRQGFLLSASPTRLIAPDDLRAPIICDGRCRIRGRRRC